MNQSEIEQQVSPQPSVGIYVFLIASIAVILFLTLYPFHFQEIGRLFKINNYFGGFEFGGYTRCCIHLAIIEPLANMALFVPFGLGIAGLSRQQGRRWVPIFLRVFILSVLLSLTIEFLQVFQPERTSNLTDLSMNSFGGILGFVCFRGIDGVRGKWEK